MVLDEGSYSKASKSFQELKGASRALASLQSSIDTKLQAAEQDIKAAAYHHGINNFSNELLIRTFLARLEDAREEDSDDHPRTCFMAMRDIAFVNRRFRNLIYGVRNC